MIESAQYQPVALPNDQPLPTDAELESKIDGEIVALWSAHLAGKATTQRTKLELQGIRHQLGERLWEMKSVLARSGRAGGWAAYRDQCLRGTRPSSQCTGVVHKIEWCGPGGVPDSGSWQ